MNLQAVGALRRMVFSSSAPGGLSVKSLPEVFSDRANGSLEVKYHLQAAEPDVLSDGHAELDDLGSIKIRSHSAEENHRPQR